MPTTHSKLDTRSEEEIGRLGATLRSALVTTGINEVNATKYSHLSMEIYRYVLLHPATADALKRGKDIYDAYTVYDGTRKAYVAAGYIERMQAVGLSSAKSGFKAYGASGGAGVLQVFVDRFETYAASQGIKLNECSLAISKLSLSIATAGTGAVSAVTGLGVVLAAYGMLETYHASQAFVQACST